MLTDIEKDALLEEAQLRLAPYAIGFVSADQSSGRTDAVLGGSGTLVKVGPDHAILTADHVLEHLPKQGHVGLMLCLRQDSYVHRFTFEVEFARRIRVGPASNDENGPDLGLLVLPTAAVADLNPRVSFYNLLHHQSQVLSCPPPIDQGGWILWGVIDEWTSDCPREPGFTQVKQFKSLCGGGGILREEHRDGFDYLHFRVKYGLTYKGPQRFEGMSGGGLWHLSATYADGRVHLMETLLSGVAFYQTHLEDEHRTIVCHGRKSVYAAVVAALRAGRT